MKKIKVKIKSNFNSFRNGLIKLKDAILLDKSYRDLCDYESSLKIFEALKMSELYIFTGGGGTIGKHYIKKSQRQTKKF